LIGDGNKEKPKRAQLKNLFPSNYDLKKLSKLRKGKVGALNKDLTKARYKHFMEQNIDLEMPHLEEGDTFEEHNLKLDTFLLISEKLKEKYPVILRKQRQKSHKIKSKSVHYDSSQRIGEIDFDFNQVSPMMEQVLRKRTTSVGKVNSRKFFGISSKKVVNGKSPQELSDHYDNGQKHIISQKASTKDRALIFNPLNYWDRIEREYAPKDNSFYGLFKSKMDMMVDLKGQLRDKNQNSFQNYKQSRDLYNKLRKKLDGIKKEEEELLGANEDHPEITKERGIDENQVCEVPQEIQKINKVRLSRRKTRNSIMEADSNYNAPIKSPISRFKFDQTNSVLLDESLIDSLNPDTSSPNPAKNNDENTPNFFLKMKKLKSKPSN